jgi:hypothetical protein
MKSVPLALYLLVFSSTLTAYAGTEIIPAGSLINCTISEPRFSSKTAAVGDPVLCQVSMVARVGPSHLPFDSYMEGRFEDYKDPGHFVGKGWMELKFDRMVVEPSTIIPISARVVDAPGYHVDKHGRILGKGHRARDIVEWSIPILWPIDLLNLPRRGPRPTLKNETRLTLKMMDDTEVPTYEPEREPSGLYRREPSGAKLDPPPIPVDEAQHQAAQMDPPRPAYQPAYQPVPVRSVPPPRPEYLPTPGAHATPSDPVVYEYIPPPAESNQVYWYAPPPQISAGNQPASRVVFYPMTDPGAPGVVPYDYVH